MRLTVLNNNEEVASVEGKGIVVLPAFLFMRNVTHALNHAAQTTVAAAPVPMTSSTMASAAPPASRPTSKTGGQFPVSHRCVWKRLRSLFVGTIKKESTKAGGTSGHRGSIVESTAMGSGRSDKEKSGSGKRSVSHALAVPSDDTRVNLRLVE